MNATWMTVWALVLVTVAGYAQYRIAAHTAGGKGVLVARSVLALIGMALGIVAAMDYPGDYRRAGLAFLIGFGMVHVPAAIILFFKRVRGEGKS